VGSGEISPEAVCLIKYNSNYDTDEKMTADIPTLVKRLRKQLGLTQAQFARELGVSLSTVNQWENARRRPQPVLLERLLEMATSLGEGSFHHLTKQEARAFKQRWNLVNSAERQALASTPVAQKFRQLEALLASAKQLGWTDLAANDDEVWERWTRLRRISYV
jgi:transcriptional regulator with XRE-family HTH domain